MKGAKYIQRKVTYEETLNKKLLFRLHKNIISILELKNEVQMSVNLTDYYEKYIKEYTKSDKISVVTRETMRNLAFRNKKNTGQLVCLIRNEFRRESPKRKRFVVLLREEREEQ